MGGETTSGYARGTCTCCLSPDQDLWGGLCYYCQPCPTCGLMGTDCDDDACLTPVAQRDPSRVSTRSDKPRSVYERLEKSRTT